VAKTSNKSIPLGKYFVRKEKITPQQLKKALAYKAENGTKLGQTLIVLGFITEEDLIDALRDQGKIHCVDLRRPLIDPQVAMRLSEKDWRRFRAIGINRIAGYTTVAMEDPSDVYAIDELKIRLASRVMPVFAEPSKIQSMLEQIFQRETSKFKTEENSAVDRLTEVAHQEGGALASGSGVDLSVQKDEEEEGEDLDKPVINMVRSILEEAVLQGASDIHIEPRIDDVLVRLRVDGALFERITLPKSWARPMIARIKILGGLDIAQRRLPQDGRMQFRYQGTRIDLRIATTPTLQGEGAVLRVLDGGRELQNLDQLDVTEAQRDRLDRIITCREGFVIATGPTGSGKTTTLYAVLQHFNVPDKKIITIEDPVENELSGITQINVNAKAGMTFAKGLRSILRQDPDIVLVGEIRDMETAQIAVQASMTGHIVLSTLHTVGAAESITRLVDMGIEPYLLGDTLRGIIAQRLVRKVCEHCKGPVKPDPRILERLDLAGDDSYFYEGQGCETCRNTGYRGRLALFEILQITPSLRGLVSRNAGTEAIHAAALEEGLTTLRDDGIRKAREGKTTLSEVLSATARG
jgi:type IV pilus assembly protein PilB